MFLYLSSLHSSSYVSFCGMNNANIMGFLSFNIFIIQFLSGILLVSYFNNMFILCYDSVLYIMIEVLFGFLVSWFHCLFAFLFMIYMFIHVFRGVWLSLLVFDSLSSVWFSGSLLFFMSLIEGSLGYMLNFGNMSYWGYMVLSGLFTIMGIFEWLIIELLWCSCYVVVFSMFLLHFVMGWLLGIFMLFHILVLHAFGSLNPILSNLSTFIISSYLLIFKDISMGIFYIYFYLYILLFFHPDIMGNADNLIVANPLSTPDHIIPELYFLILFYLLRCMAFKSLGMICMASSFSFYYC